MSLDLKTQVELRTTGSDSNGGGVVPRAYGQDLVSDGSGGVKSGSANFVAGDVGHSIFIFAPPWSAAGWTGGLYTINSVNGGTNVATLNSSPGLNLVGGVFYVCSGKDYSYQDSAQYTFSDLASSNGTSGTPSVTSASHSFVQNDVGNIIQITAGTNWFATFFQIVSVSGGAATLDRACGSTNSLSSGTYAVGGALLTLTKAFALTTQVAVGSNNGNGAQLWMKSGTYTVTSTVAANSQQYTMWTGYDATRGDDTGNRPLLTTATTTTSLVSVGASGLQTAFLVDNVNFSNTTAGTAYPGLTPVLSNSIYLNVRRCKFTTLYAAITGDTGSSVHWAGVSCSQCEIANSVHMGIELDGFAELDLVDCYIHGSGAAAIEKHGSLRMFGCIFDGNHTVFSSVPNEVAVTIDHCAFINSSTDGLAIWGTNNWMTVNISNSIFYGNGGWGLAIGTPGQLKLFGVNNAFGNNTSGPFENILVGLIGNIYLTANPFTSGSDYTLNNTAGGGALLRAAGYPMKYNAATTKADIGAVQISDNSGGSSGAKPRAFF